MVGQLELGLSQLPLARNIGLSRIMFFSIEWQLPVQHLYAVFQLHIIILGTILYPIFHESFHLILMALTLWLIAIPGTWYLRMQLALPDGLLLHRAGKVELFRYA